MDIAKKCITDWKSEFEFMDDSGTIIYTNIKALHDIIEVAYLEGKIEAQKDATDNRFESDKWRGYNTGGLENRLKEIINI